MLVVELQAEEDCKTWCDTVFSGSSCWPNTAAKTVLKLSLSAQSSSKLILLIHKLHNKLHHVDEMSFVVMSSADVKPNATDALFSLPHVSGMCLVLTIIIFVMSDDVSDNAGWCTE